MQKHQLNAKNEQNHKMRLKIDYVIKCTRVYGKPWEVERWNPEEMEEIIQGEV